jgi:hypothetical protein
MTHSCDLSPGPGGIQTVPEQHLIKVMSLLCSMGLDLSM